MATTSYGTPYVEAADLVSGYPSTSLTLADRVDDISFKGNGINDQTGTAYTLDILDAGKTVTLNNSSAVTVTIPTNTAEPIEVGSLIRMVNLGTGLVTIQPAATVTINGGNILLSQYSSITLVKLATNTWSAYGTSGIWRTYTPTWTNLTVGNGGNTGAYIRIGSVVHARWSLAFGSTTTVSGIFYPTDLPVGSSGDNNGYGWSFDASATKWNNLIYVPQGPYFLSDGGDRYNATTPWTWANGDLLRFQITYEGA